MFCKFKLIAYLPLVVSITWVVFASSISIAIDILQWNDYDKLVLERFSNFPLLWYHLMSEASPTENLQWMLQSTGVIISFVAYAKLKHSNRYLSQAWLLLCAGLFIMLIEDSLNFRHVVFAYYIEEGLNDDDRWRVYYKTIWELCFYLLLASLMLISALLLIRYIKPDKHCLAFIVIAYFLYGIAALGSALRKVFDWQERFGDFLIDKFHFAEIDNWATGFEILKKARNEVEGYTHTMGFLLIDHWYEESLELLSAGFLITAILLLYRLQFGENQL